MSSDNWNTSAEHERIKNRARKREAKRQERAAENPLAFGWEKTDDGTSITNSRTSRSTSRTS